MPELKKNIETAKNFIFEVYGEQVVNLQLEAAQLSQGDKTWKITFSFLREQEPINQLQAALGTNNQRIFKTVEIDPEKNEVIGLQMGSFAATAEAA